MPLMKTRRTLLFLSFLAFPVTFIFLSPVLAVYGAYQGVLTIGLLIWFLVLVTSLVFGRAFCAYLCPLGGLQRCLYANRHKPLVKVRYLRYLKYALWAPWVGLIIGFAIQAGGFHTFDPMAFVEGWPLYGKEAAIAFFSFTGVTTLTALLLGKRGFCHYLCFFSPLNIIGSWIAYRLKLPSLRVRVVDKDRCTQCYHCESSCPMSLNIVRMVHKGSMEHDECIVCGNCTRVCRHHVLEYGWHSGRRRYPQSPHRIRKEKAMVE